MNKKRLLFHTLFIIILLVVLVLEIMCLNTKAQPPTNTPLVEDVTESEMPQGVEVKPFDDETPEELKSIIVTATAYCPCMKCCGKTDGITATGTKATAGRTIAVDPSVIPYGTEVIIGDSTYYAEDCGGAVKGNEIDIFFDTHEEAKQFGRQRLVVMIKN